MFCVILRNAHIAEMGSAARKLFLTNGRLLAGFVVGSASGAQLVRITRRLAMVYPIENQMVVDEAWDWNESMTPDKARLKREKQAYEEAEREDRENGKVL